MFPHPWDITFVLIALFSTILRLFAYFEYGCEGDICLLGVELFSTDSRMFSPIARLAQCLCLEGILDICHVWEFLCPDGFSKICPFRFENLIYRPTFVSLLELKSLISSLLVLWCSGHWAVSIVLEWLQWPSVITPRRSVLEKEVCRVCKGTGTTEIKQISRAFGTASSSNAS